MPNQLKKSCDMSSTSHRSSSLGTHAIVIGGSIAGLLAGRVLANYFDRVTIIERDRLPENPRSRPGVSQSPHVHILLKRGQTILEELFPGLQQELIAAGSLAVDMAGDLAWLTPAGWGIPFDSGLEVLLFSRDLLDWLLRRRLAAIPNLEFLAAGEVKGLLPNPAKTGVAGVSVRLRPQSEDEKPKEIELWADLIADASGRKSKAAQWLKNLGYASPTETAVNSFLGYASRLYQGVPHLPQDCRGTYIQTAPPKRNRGAVLLPVEGNRWIVSLCGGDRDYPPTDEVAFLEFARSLPSPIIYNAIHDAQPLSPIFSYRATENRWRHYEELIHYPEGFIALGDAVCAFNPTYGQGMTIAALGALTLDRALQKIDSPSKFPRLGKQFQKQLSQITAVPWMLVTSEDYRYRGTEGKKPTWTTKLMHRYIDRLVTLTTLDPQIRLAWLKAMHMLESPAILFHPSIMLQILGIGQQPHAIALRAGQLGMESRQ